MLHMLSIYEFRVNFCTLMFILKQFDPLPRFDVGNFRTCADLESRAQPGGGGGRRLGRFLCQNHPTKSDVTSGRKLS